jgi:hypothetical protein
MAKKKKRKRARSRKSNPSTKKPRRRKKRRNPVASTTSKPRRRRKGRRKSRRNPAKTSHHRAKRRGKRRKSRRNPESVLLDIGKALGVGLGAAALAGIGTFVVGQKMSGGTNLVTQQKLRMIQGAMVALGIGGAYLLATKAKSPMLAAAAVAGTAAGVAGPEIVSAGVKAIATQQNPAAAAAAKGQTTQNGLSLEGLSLEDRQRMNGLSLRQPGMSGVFDEGDSFG